MEIENCFRRGAALEGPEGEGTMRTSLIRTVAQLETLPEDMKEHLGSNVVKNLVNPSLYPFAKGQSLIIPEDKAPKDGSSVRATYFIPLLDPVEETNAAEKIFERCKGEQENPDFDDTFQWLPADIWVDAEGKARFLSYINNLNPVEFAEAYECIAAIFSALLPQFVPVLNRWKKEEDIDALKYRSRRLQVIVKLTNTELTPDKQKKKYPGGEWHVEGRQNESIACVGLYYYSISNIKASSLELKRRGCGGKFPGRTLPTTENSFIVFSNAALQHKVPEYKLDDATKPGHRKVLAFFLCDPEKDVLSTGRVPPQQRSWYLRELRESFPPTKCSQDILEMIAAGLAGTISKDKALQRRAEMLAKRDRERGNRPRPRD